jgi:hypothetical protein
MKALLGEKFEEKAHQPHVLMKQRAEELRFSSECVAALAASEFSAVIRLPNAVNRTSGQVRLFAQQQRSRSFKDRKVVDMFRRVQKAITSSVPGEFFEFLEAAEIGVRILADAHLEWMELRDLPLGIQKDVCRIPVTLGNLFVDQLCPKQYIHLSPDDFEEVLMLNALEEDDPIAARHGERSEGA